jgi:glycosyltransferase involved in cell wall biosynthesis
MILKNSMPRVAAIIVNLVPYHHARWEACALVTGSETHLVELTDRDEFKVLEFSRESHFQRHTLCPKSGSPEAALAWRMSETLDAIRPDVVCVSGWGLSVSLAAMKWAVSRSVPIVMLSESNEFDEVRSTIKEWIKRRLVGLCSAGLAGGSPQADYLVKLGLPRDRVFVGYDVVDNRFFKETSKELGAGSWELGGQKTPYFLACARFGKKKNLPGLIRAYSRYRELGKPSTIDSANTSAFDLVIAGDGEERAEIEQTIQGCRVSDHVHLVGAKGYMDLPAYYGHARAFIHASTTEQWGLVVNEAMASGLPVLVSNRCGCASDLVREGENGWTFDPTNQEQIADLMLRIASDEDARARMGSRSREIIAGWGPERFASGVKAAVDAALAAPKKRDSLLDRVILWAMTRM